MKNLTKAIISVMKEVKGMEKNSKVGKGAYAYDGTKDQDVKEAFNNSLSNNGLCIVPIEITPDVKIERFTDDKGNIKQSVFTEVKTKYLLMHESGESIEIQGYGHGVDTMDKSAGKATTYALKNALLYTFLTPVGKIDDTDTTHSNDLTVVKSEKKAKQAISEKNFGLVLERIQNGEVDIYKKVISTYEMTNKQAAELKEVFDFING